MNDRRQVVGHHGYHTGPHRAFLYENGELANRNALIGADRGGLIQVANDIIDPGMIIHSEITIRMDATDYAHSSHAGPERSGGPAEPGRELP